MRNQQLINGFITPLPLTIAFTIAFTLALGACGGGSSDDGDRGPDAPVDQSRGALTAAAAAPEPCVHVAASKGTYRCAAPSAASGQLERVGALTWRYLDQALFANSDSPATDPDDVAAFASDKDMLSRLYDQRRDDARVNRPGVADFSRTVRIDRLGRRWMVSAVDWARFAQKRLDNHRDLAESLPDVQALPIPENPANEADEPGYDVPLSWSDGSCSGGVTWATWNGDDRTLVDGPSLTDRQKTVVKIVSGTGNLGCSGVLVDDEWVLTAAHCVTGPSGGAHNPVNTTVTVGAGLPYDNFETSGAVDIVLDGAPWNGKVNSDYALIHLDTNLGDTNGFMILSVASDSQVTTNPLHNLAYPPHQAPVSSCIATSKMTHLIEDAKSVTTKLVKLYHDVESGHSGSPIFYCPTDADDVCGPGEAGYVITVVSSIHFDLFGNVTDVRGPRVKEFQPWASGLLPSQ